MCTGVPGSEYYGGTVPPAPSPASRQSPPDPPSRRDFVEAAPALPGDPGSGCLQLHPTAATARRWTVSHLHPERQHLVVPHIRAMTKQALSQAQVTAALGLDDEPGEMLRSRAASGLG